MVFSSIIFLFLFLPLVLGMYHLLFLPVSLGFGQNFWRRLSNLFLLLSSLVFYFWGETFLVWIVITSTFIDYVCGLIISGGMIRRKAGKKSSENPRLLREKLGFAISVCSNLAFLGIFKYFNFGVESYNRFLEVVGLSELALNDVMRITLPLGISFYTFQSMSYTIDVYRGQVKATRNLIDFACYVTMFPQLVAGPIVRYRDIADQLVSRVMTREHFASGVSRFILGLGKKVIVANMVSVVAENIFELPASNLTCSVAWLGSIAYAIQIYFDFSGYSDMAIGLGRMFGFDFKENFNYPYISQSVQEFWRRWHISLSTWFRDYLYIPLGGSRGSTKRTYFNLITVFFLCGLWHGASWTFVVWGFYHGLFLILERVWLGQFLKRLPGMLRHIYTLLVILCGWVLFTSATLPHGLRFLAVMFGFGESTGAVQELSWHLTRDVKMALLAGVIFSMPVLPALARLKENLAQSYQGRVRAAVELPFAVCRTIGLYLILIVCLMFLSAGTHNPFIYFRF
ncbi:MBOAT family O-acyltransferase [Planctomycetota bacterium]